MVNLVAFHYITLVKIRTVSTNFLIIVALRELPLHKLRVILLCLAFLSLDLIVLLNLPAVEHSRAGVRSQAAHIRTEGACIAVTSWSDYISINRFH